MAITSNLEKIYFNWILLNADFFKTVHGYFFENDDIKFIYDCIRNEFLASDDDTVPSKKEIINLVKIYDENNTIEVAFIKSLLKFDKNDFRDDFIKPRFSAWVKSNYLLNGLLNSYEKIAKIDKTDLSQVEEAINDIKFNIDEATSVQMEKSDIGLDFDDVDAHDQELEVNKITSGFKTFDTITDGGWDRKTLNLFMGAPGSGKCSHYDTKIIVRNKNNGEIKTIKIGDYYNKMAKKYKGKNINK